MSVRDKVAAGLAILLLSRESLAEGGAQSPPPLRSDHVHALLCYPNSHHERHYVSSIKKVHDVLLSSRVPREQIHYVGPDIDIEARTYPPSVTGLLDACNSLRERVQTNDVFFFYTTAHGGLHTNGLSNESFIMFSDSTIFCESDSPDYFRGIHPRYGLFCFPQCRGGGFAQQMGKGKCMGFAASSRSERSFTTLAIQPAAQYFVPALFGKVPEQERDVIDRDGDGRISIQEAYTYARSSDIFTHPLVAWTGWKNEYRLFFEDADPAYISFDLDLEWEK